MAFIGLWYHLDGLPQQVYLLGALILWGLEVRNNSYVWVGNQMLMLIFILAICSLGYQYLPQPSWR